MTTTLPRQLNSAPVPLYFAIFADFLDGVPLGLLNLTDGRTGAEQESVVASFHPGAPSRGGVGGRRSAWSACAGNNTCLPQPIAVDELVNVSAPVTC
jgi:hypothetical protein